MISGEMRGVLLTRSRRVLLALGFCLAMGPGYAAAQGFCVGDCNGDDAVRINELITAVNISLGNVDLSVCEAADANQNGLVAINELILAVNNSLNGCPDRPVFNAKCTLEESSSLSLLTGLLVLPVEPAADGAVAEVNFQCRDVAGGGLECDCSVGQFDAMNIPGIGEVCLEQFSPCETRPADCTGDIGIDTNVMADHNIGQCTGRVDCEDKCAARCEELGAGFFRQASTCEDFCIGGANDGQVCGMNADCPGGACGGPDGGADGHICECVCAEVGTGTGTEGGVSCSLGVAITVELDGSGICGDIAPAITLAPVCGELTTGTAFGRLDNVANNPGINITPEPLMGVPSSCEDIRAGTVSGSTLVGHLAFFGSAVGDILTENVFVCE